MIIGARLDVAAIVVEGPDARRYLHSQMSNDIESIPVGGSRQSLLLEPTGKVVAITRLWREDEERWAVLVEAKRPDVADAVEARLRRFLIRTKATITRRSIEVTRLISSDGSAIVVDGHPTHPAWWEDGAVHDVIGVPFAGPDGCVMVDDDAIEVARVAAGWPANGSEVIAGETVPASLGIVRVTVSFTKGCYPGQELVERMDSRGATAPRTLRMIDGAGRAVGDTVLVAGEPVGVVTSVAGDVALAFVDRSCELGSIRE